MAKHIAHRQNRDQALATVETANLRNFRQVPFFGQQHGHGVHISARYTQHFVDTVHHHAHRGATQRHHHDAAVLIGSAVGQAKHAAQRNQWQQAVAQGHDPQHMRFRVRHLHDQFRDLHNFLHVIDHDGVLLMRHLKAHQVQLIASFEILGLLQMISI